MRVRSVLLRRRIASHNKSFKATDPPWPMMMFFNGQPNTDLKNQFCCRKETADVASSIKGYLYSHADSSSVVNNFIHGVVMDNPNMKRKCTTRQMHPNRLLSPHIPHAPASSH